MNAVASKTLAVVLAGGRSERYGRDKAFEPFGGGTLLSRAVEVVSNVADDAWVLTRFQESQQQYLAQVGDATIVPDEDDLGPHAALATALARSDHKTVVVIPVDSPALDPDDLRRLMHLHRLSGRVVHVESTEGPRFDILVGRRNLLMRRARVARAMRHVALPGPGLLLPPRPGWNVNRPADLRQASPPAA